jgi:hypothetical protein
MFILLLAKRYRIFTDFPKRSLNSVLLLDENCMVATNNRSNATCELLAVF